MLDTCQWQLKPRSIEICIEFAQFLKIWTVQPPLRCVVNSVHDCAKPLASTTQQETEASKQKVCPTTCNSHATILSRSNCQFVSSVFLWTRDDKRLKCGPACELVLQNPKDEHYVEVAFIVLGSNRQNSMKSFAIWKRA